MPGRFSFGSDDTDELDRISDAELRVSVPSRGFGSDDSMDNSSSVW